MKKTEEEILIKGEFEEVIKIDNHLYIKNSKEILCVLPYTISPEGLLDKVGVINIAEEYGKEKVSSLLTGYVNQDDPTNLVCANRILYEITGVNLTNAAKWMYLGKVNDSLSSVSSIRIYAVDITGIEIQKTVLDEDLKKRFELLDSSKLLHSSDLLFLGAFTRLFSFFIKISKIV